MSVWQIILVVAAVWLVAAVVVCALWWPRIARRLRSQHHAPNSDGETRR